MTDRRTLEAEIVLGDDMEKWLQSDQGRYMVAGFESYEAEAVEALTKVWPWRWRRIAQLQERIRLARRFSQIAAEAVVNGQQALQAIRDVAE